MAKWFWTYCVPCFCQSNDAKKISYLGIMICEQFTFLGGLYIAVYHQRCIQQYAPNAICRSASGFYDPPVFAVFQEDHGSDTKLLSCFIRKSVIQNEDIFIFKHKFRFWNLQFFFNKS